MKRIYAFALLCFFIIPVRIMPMAEDQLSQIEKENLKADIKKELEKLEQEGWIIKRTDGENKKKNKINSVRRALESHRYNPYRSTNQ